MNKKKVCPVCVDDDTLPLQGGESGAVSRRDFLRTVGTTAAVVAVGVPLWAEARVVAAPTPSSAAETAVKGLFDTLTDDQKKAVCFDWDYKDPKRGLLRTHVSNNWKVTPHPIRSEFYTKKQQDIIFDIFKGIIHPDWHARILKQLKDDTSGRDWGFDQAIAIFGTPGTDKFECVMTGRHMTIRADGNSEKHVAFGGPIFYGHAASGFHEKIHHPGNVFWHQAVLANRVYQLLDPKQQARALVETLPKESAVPFRGPQGPFPGIPVAELAGEQKQVMQKILQSLIEPYRKEDQDEALACLTKQGGLDKCSLAFYKDDDIGEDGEWDNWRLEGPAFVWHFRGAPHVHVWVHVADEPSVPLNAKG